MVEVIGAKIPKPLSSDSILDEVDKYRKERDVFVQVFDHEKIVGKEHLQWAYDKAVYCFNEGVNRSKSLEIETLLWSSGKWQIKNAIKKMGIKDHSKNAVVILDSDPKDFLNFMDWEREDRVLKPSLKKLKKMGITDVEIESTDKPYDLIFEKMATAVL